MNGACYLQTGQATCHDAGGRETECAGSGQDSEFRCGVPWPEARFKIKQETVTDRLTGLTWCRNANLAEFPLMWLEALDYVARMNCSQILGYNDWRLPNRRELRSLISHQTKRPALPQNQPFTHIFNGWYWSSTTAVISPAHAWYVNIEGGRMFYGGKDQSFLVWPVRGQGNGVLPVTGQTRCYAETGEVIPCAGTGQDGESSCGCAWPSPRFQTSAEEVIDRLTNLRWRRTADLNGASNWTQALAAVAQLNDQPSDPRDWRLPNINELESLVDCSTHSPALPAGHPFAELQDVYWSCTTSLYEPDWAWALYLGKGAIGVGQKTQARFHVWAVRN
ncbi:MAG TPA: DUF1566 domain-containing protein [Gammaproteobacteria bacterium]|nr:DUF1566 domain-containing protein [Gammaproteobacteria bacterium]